MNPFSIFGYTRDSRKHIDRWTNLVLAVFAAGIFNTQAQADNRVIDWRADDARPLQGGWRVERIGNAGEASLRVRPKGDPEGAALQANFASADEKPPSAQLVYPVNFEAGHAYRFNIEISASEPTKADVMMRRTGAPYDALGMRSLVLGPSWQTIEFEAAWPIEAAGNFRVMATQSEAKLLVRRFTVDDLGILPLGTAPTKPFPSTLIGLHVNKLGEHHTWLSLGQGLIRLWDTRTNWHHLGPTPQEFDSFSNAAWKRLDMYVDYVKGNDPKTAILYTLGEPPPWASGSPEAKCAYGIGTCGAPATLQQWRHYVRTLAVRYKGRIKYWEIWNEPENRIFFLPTLSLTELAQAANEELKAVDPENKIVSPGFNIYGLRALHDFLRDGGGKFVDIIGFHLYYDGEPEKLTAMAFNVRQMMRAYGVGEKPIWNTEGSPLCQRREQGACILNGLTNDEQDVVVERAILTMWLNGIEGYAYYTLEGMGGRSVALLGADLRSETQSAEKLAIFSKWLVGSTATKVSKWGRAGHTIQLNQQGKTFYVIWSEEPTENLSIPADWRVKSYESLGQAPVVVGNEKTIAAGRIPIRIAAND